MNHDKFKNLNLKLYKSFYQFKPPCTILKTGLTQAYSLLGPPFGTCKKMVLLNYIVFIYVWYTQFICSKLYLRLCQHSKLHYLSYFRKVDRWHYISRALLLRLHCQTSHKSGFSHCQILVSVVEEGLHGIPGSRYLWLKNKYRLRGKYPLVELL